MGGYGRFVLSGYECLWQLGACEILHVCTLCIWRCQRARFGVEMCVFYAPYIHFHSFIHSIDRVLLVVSHVLIIVIW